MSATGINKGAPGVTRGAALSYLQREADLDGLVTVSEQEIGAALGISQTAANFHIASLCEDGFIARVGRVKGVKSHAIVAYQLSEDALP